MDNKYYTSYKGIWYKWIEYTDVWSFSDTEEGWNNVSYFSNRMRWDEAYNKFLEQLKEYNDERRKNEEVEGSNANLA